MKEEIIQGQVLSIKNLGIIQDYSGMEIYPKTEQSIVTLLCPDDVKKNFYMLTDEVVFKPHDFIRSIVSEPAFWHKHHADDMADGINWQKRTAPMISAGTLSDSQAITDNGLLRYQGGDEIIGQVISYQGYGVRIADVSVPLVKLRTREDRIVLIVDIHEYKSGLSRAGFVRCFCDDSNERFLINPTCQSLTVSDVAPLSKDEYYKLKDEQPQRGSSWGQPRRVDYGKTRDPN